MCLSLRISGVFALGETHSVWAAQIQNPQEQNAAGPGSLSYMSDLMGQHLAPKHLSPAPPCHSVEAILSEEWQQPRWQMKPPAARSLQ